MWSNDEENQRPDTAFTKAYSLHNIRPPRIYAETSKHFESDFEEENQPSRPLSRARSKSRIVSCHEKCMLCLKAKYRCIVLLIFSIFTIVQILLWNVERLIEQDFSNTTRQTFTLIFNKLTEIQTNNNNTHKYHE